MVAPKNAPASRHVEAADRKIEIDVDEAEPIPSDRLSEIIAQAGADAAHVGYHGQPSMFELASAAEKAGLPVVGTDLDVLGALADPGALRAAAERSYVRTISEAGSISSPRVITVLVVADSHGNVTSLADTDRSLTMDGHALVHETPSPELLFGSEGDAFRASLFESARGLVKALRYAGVVEVLFHVDPRGQAWVSDVSIGLPRHHTLIEMVTGLDLVALQLRVAAGDELPAELESIEPRGHALDAAVLALDRPEAPVEAYSVPPAPQGRVRATSSATVGMALPGDDRPLIAKLTTQAPIRHGAVLSMDRVLAEMRAEPFENNISTLRRILADHSFRAGQYDTRSVGRFVDG